MTRRIAWFAGLGIAVMVALLMRSLDSDWLATVSTALIFIVLPDMLARSAALAPGHLLRDDLGRLESSKRPASKSATDILEGLWRHCGVAHGIGDRGMPQKVLEPPCIHPPGRQCISRRMPQHVDMDRERQPGSLASPFNHAPITAWTLRRLLSFARDVGCRRARLASGTTACRR
jgi:hypothetical protein